MTRLTLSISDHDRTDGLMRRARRILVETLRGISTLVKIRDIACRWRRSHAIHGSTSYATFYGITRKSSYVTAGFDYNFREKKTALAGHTPHLIFEAPY